MGVPKPPFSSSSADPELFRLEEVRPCREEWREESAGDDLEEDLGRGQNPEKQETDVCCSSTESSSSWMRSLVNASLLWLPPILAAFLLSVELYEMKLRMNLSAKMNVMPMKREVY